MTKSIIAGACAAISLSMGADAGFTGYTVERVVTVLNNVQYRVYANFDNLGLPQGTRWVFLGVRNFQPESGSLAGRHWDAATDSDGDPAGSWMPSANTLGIIARDNDSWVSASGSGTSTGADASLDSGFSPSSTGEIPNGAGWFDATPGTANLVGAGGGSGYRMLIMQIVRTEFDDYPFNARLSIDYRAEGSDAVFSATATLFVQLTAVCGGGPDCNQNGCNDSFEIFGAPSLDGNQNGILDSCESDCNNNGIADGIELAQGIVPDCNTNGVPDACDVAAGTSPDIDANNKPDECQTVVVNAGGSIQSAINAAPTSEMRIINVAPGTYAGPINLLGRPIRLVGTAGPALTTISGTGGQNLSVIRAIAGEPSISLVKGFTIEGGTTGGPLPGSPGVLAGGGVLFAFSSTSMADCVLQNNGSAFGAGAYLRTHDGSVTGCTFRNNTSQAYAGGLQLFDCTTTVSGCTFSGNLAVTAGGAMHMVNGQPKLVNCSFGANICNEQGGAMSWDPVSNGSLLSLTGCTISGNTASTIGGGIFIYPTGVASETQLVGTTVCGNAVRNISGPYQADATSTICDCRADLSGDSVVNGVDLAIILSNWGTASAAADLTGDGTVGGSDLAIILAAWGTCPST